MSRNEAAERLVEFIVDSPYSATVRDGYTRDLDEALATERRLTVERVREAVEHGYTTKSLNDILDSILDDLATADVDEEAGDAALD